MTSKTLFVLAALITLWGVGENMSDYNGSIASTGTMAMNSFYMLGMALFAASAAAKQVWESK